MGDIGLIKDAVGSFSECNCGDIRGSLVTCPGISLIVRRKYIKTNDNIGGGSHDRRVMFRLAHKQTIEWKR